MPADSAAIIVAELNFLVVSETNAEGGGSAEIAGENDPVRLEQSSFVQKHIWYSIPPNPQ